MFRPLPHRMFQRSGRLGSWIPSFREVLRIDPPAGLTRRLPLLFNSPYSVSPVTPISPPLAGTPHNSFSSVLRTLSVATAEVHTALPAPLHSAAEGDFRCVYVNVEAAQAHREDLSGAMRTILGALAGHALLSGDQFLDEVARPAA